MANDLNGAQEEDMRADLEAMLKAGRDLGPYMDRALVDSYMERQRNAIKQSKREQPRPIQPAAMTQSWVGPRPLQMVMLAMMLTTIVAVVVFSHGWLLWMVFPLFWIFGRPWRRWGGGSRYRMAQRQARDDYPPSRWQTRASDWRDRDGGDI